MVLKTQFFYSGTCMEMPAAAAEIKSVQQTFCISSSQRGQGKRVFRSKRIQQCEGEKSL